MSELRLFIAAELPDTWRTALAATMDELRAALPVRLRWVRPEGIHLTLKFFGEVAEERAPAIVEAMQAAARAQAPVALRGGPLGTFGTPTRPRVLWAGVAGDHAALTRLARSLDEQCRPLGFAAERQPFRPHLTLARVPDQVTPIEAARIAPALRFVAPPALPPFTTDALTLIRSELGPGGARYTPLAHTELLAKMS